MVLSRRAEPTTSDQMLPKATPSLKLTRSHYFRKHCWSDGL